ncbi:MULTISPECIES: nucleotidyl transferase AbiEii/AbiGii toxin family protein [Sphingomonas]|uniref:nucleotidyl transferase AbiEii/AbiGii toxin family protein n=1 Tax=Sphingomonas TaxID=13687 RepID=UPI000DEED09D|nr:MULTISPECIES: nucleotidyl transferase AbiEii/AbiGii toxin family protein [Sphingomonas]
MAKDIKDVGTSVRARLLSLSRKTGQANELLLTRYALERLLYRMGMTEHASRFVLKGAMLMTTWFDDPHRPTRDIDLLCFGDPRPDEMLQVFREICSIQEKDGVEFDVDSLGVTANREDLAYGGLRLQTYATISGARLRIIIDIGFGDSTEPGLEELELPVLLDQPQPHLRAYARETVVAEKFQAMVMLGQANSRLKDYYDLWLLARSYEFDPHRLAGAIAATFRRRGTPIPTDVPDGLKREFYEDRAKTSQWRAFVDDVAVDPGSLADVAAALSDFLMPAARAGASLTDGGADGSAAGGGSDPPANSADDDGAPPTLVQSGTRPS